ncbi:MAG: Mur ligase family protein [Verrucomicrobium sp.]
MALFSRLPHHVHFIGICGRAMGALAMELKRLGVRVTGADKNIFPPMGGYLTEAGIAFHDSFAAAHLDPAPDHVVVGSYFPPSNPEVAAVLERRLPWSTLPGFLGKFLLGETKNVVVTGTNGKTTTTSMLAWILKCGGKAPSWMVAGESENLGKMLHLSQRPRFVLEGDEYISGLGDLNPKFLHYQPERVLVTNAHWDHVEVFSSERQYQRGFEALVDLVPPSGGLVLNSDDPFVAGLAGRRPLALIETVGFDRTAQHRVTGCKSTQHGVSFKILGQEFRLASHGRINAHNAAMAVVMARQCGVEPEKAALALEKWIPVAGRQEIWRSGKDLTIIKEEAYHPQALAGAIEAVRSRFPGRRLVLALQPRYTGGRSGPHQRDLPAALAGVNVALITDPMEIVWQEHPFSSRKLGTALRGQGCQVKCVKKVGDLQLALSSHLQEDDVLLVSLAYRNEAFFEKLKAL